MNSVWDDTAVLPHFEALQDDVTTDVLIIGGGLAGILCAYMLDCAGVDYILIEADRICSGVTSCTTAKITSQHGLIYSKLIREFDVNTARMYLEANEKAIREYRKMCSNIDCDFEDRTSYVYSIDNRLRLDHEIEALKKIKYPAFFDPNPDLPFSTSGAVGFRNQAQFNPLKFIAAISGNLHIYEHTTAVEYINHAVLTKSNKISFNRVIITSHFPFINKHGSYFMKLYQHRSYVIAADNTLDIQDMYVDDASDGFSFRSYKNLLLVGGGSHRTGKKGGNWHAIEKFIEKYFPDSHIHYYWATQDCMSLDSIPYIGHYSLQTSDCFVASGFNKWGITSAMTSAMLLTDMICGRNNPYVKIFSPSRTMFRSQLFTNMLESTVNLLTPSKKRCPHLGCALKWNDTEHSWDCPCHGSRFTAEGQLIDNPATGSLKKRN